MISLSVSENETSFKLSSTWNRATLFCIFPELLLDEELQSC